MLHKPITCRGCTLYESGTGFMVPEGHGTNNVLVVGEALGKEEARDGLPFRQMAQAGSLLERALKRLGLSREQFRLTNCVRCQPPKDWLSESPWEFEALRHCRPYLETDIQSMKPKVILALGGIATRELTGFAGKYQGISYIRGYAIPSLIGDSLVIGSYHPSFIRRGAQHLFGVLCHDIMRAVQVANAGWTMQWIDDRYDQPSDMTDVEAYEGVCRCRLPEYQEEEGNLRPAQPYCQFCHGTGVVTKWHRKQRRNIALQPIPRHYQPTPTIDDAWAFYHRVRSNPNLWLTYDIETPNSATIDEDEREEDPSFEIIQIQFSLGPGEGIVFPGQDPSYMSVARMIMALGNPKAGHNCWLFDDPRLLANGFKIGGDFPHDTMAMWHHMQPDLPANLQSVASFAGMDKPWKHLAGRKGTGEEEGDDMGIYGCCDVDAPQRILQWLPEALKKRGIWDGYARRVYQVRPILADMERRGIPINDTKRVAFGAELQIALDQEWDEMQTLVPSEVRNLHPKDGYKKCPKPEPRDGDATEHAGEPAVWKFCSDGHWYKVLSFTPSPTQLIRYMRFRGHPVPVNFKTEHETTAKLELERLYNKTGDPLYKRVQVYREIQTMKSTFVDGWAPKGDGRVHTTFTFAPATAQLSSRDPNVQNSPQHTRLSTKFGEVIEAPLGYKLISFDHKSFHALMLGYLAQDPDYTRICRIDVHSFVAAQFLKLKSADAMWKASDDSLHEFLSTVKRDHEHDRFKAKAVILGWGFGRGYRAIFQAMREHFSGEGETKRLTQTLEGLFPKTVAYRKTVMNKAHYDTCLKSPFQFIRWFWDVFNFDPKTGRLRHGDQAEEAVAYLPANCAFGIMREEMLTMRAKGYDERFGYVNSIHDSHVFCCPDPLVDECVHTIKPLMESESLYLKGFWCGADVKVGQNFAPRSEGNPVGMAEVRVDVRNAEPARV